MKDFLELYLTNRYKNKNKLKNNDNSVNDLHTLDVKVGNLLLHLIYDKYWNIILIGFHCYIKNNIAE